MAKEILWKEYPGSRLTGESKEHHGFHEFGAYIITRRGGWYHLSTFTNMGKMRPMGDFKLLSDAKASAQADFDARILSALSMPADIEPVAWHRCKSFMHHFVLGAERPANNTSNPNEWTPLYAAPVAE